MSRIILHLDLDAFFCAVEEQFDPSLRGKAFAVGGRPDQRGVVASCSYAARQYGVRSAMPMSTALHRCPHLLIVRHHFDRYHDASHKVMAILNDLTPFVEQLSIDEAFLDVTGLREDGQTLAQRLQARINNELHLPCSLGVASSKLVAKIANNLGKAAAKGDGPPNAIKVVPAGGEAAFLAPLPIEELWGVGPKTAEQLHRLSIHTIGMLARWPEEDLSRRFGKLGRDLSQRARGLDDRPVETERETKSISKETTFSHDLTNGDDLRRTIRHLAEGVGRQVRQSNLRGTTVKLKLRWADFTTISRQLTLEVATDHDDDIADAALKLFDNAWIKGQPVRLLGVGLSGFENAAQQLGLWDGAETERKGRLQSALDDLRERFGDDVIQRGSHLQDEE
ncbi:MAG: DNA polymerase IV [Anaerolineae bacterium]|nr:DNA polymerase IV [Anaerolineae bacterium]